MKKETSTYLYITKIPPQLKADFKAYCASHQSSMKKIIVQFMQDKTKKTNATH